MIATIIMWIVLPMFLGAIALGYGFWTWNAAVDMIESVRDRSGESIEIGQLNPEESEKAMREAILGEQQPEPTSTDEPSAHDLVIADMAARKEFGLAKYGSLLQASYGRDNLQDLYEELLDACVYIRNEIERRKLAEGFPMRTIEGS